VAGSIVRNDLSGSSYIGEIKMMHLTPAQMLQVAGSEWVLCDGSPINGSKYSELTGSNNAPDMRGRFPRMQDHGASVNPNGNVGIGTHTNDSFKSHNHGGGSHNHWYKARDRAGAPMGGSSGEIHPRDSTGWQSDYDLRKYGFYTNHNHVTIIDTEGGSETAPKHHVVNYFIKID